VKKLKKMKKNRRIALYVIVAVFLIAVLYFANNPITGIFFADNTTREYKFSREEFPEYYSTLPPKPADFDQVRLMWETGIIRDIPERINISYWKQPEWFPEYEKTFVNALETIATSNRIPIWSVGIFDAQIYRRINKDWLENPTIPETQGHGIVEIKNESVVVKHRFWVRASVGSLRWFGVGLRPVYPSKSLLSGSARWKISKKDVTQDPEMVKQYISISAAESESNAEEFNLGIYWPELSPEYQKEVLVTAEIKKGIPKGLYVVGIEVGGPSREYQHEQSLKYGLTYTDPNIGMFVNPGKFELFIEII